MTTTDMTLIEQESKGVAWSQGDDPVKFIEQLKDQFEMDEAGVGRMLLQNYSKNLGIDAAMQALKDQFPNLPDFELTSQDRARQCLDEARDFQEKGQKRLARIKIKDALTLDPTCADAYLLELDLLPMSASFKKAYGILQNAIKAGRSAIGSDEEFEELVGEFWGWPKTRPYMRAMEELFSMCYVEVEHSDKAVEHGKEMLRLNPNDNQGVRMRLLYLLMAKGRWGEAEALWQDYKDAGDAWWYYGRVLLTAHQKGPKDARTKKRMKEALDYNPTVPALLMTGNTHMMNELMGSYFQMRHPSEAAAMSYDFILALKGSFTEASVVKEDNLPEMMHLFMQSLDAIGSRTLTRCMTEAAKAIGKLAPEE